MSQRDKPIVYPYIPNSVPATKAAMLKAVNAKSVEAFYADIPESIRLKGKLNLPGAVPIRGRACPAYRRAVSEECQRA